MDKNSSKDPHNNEDAGLGEYFGQKRKMVKDDLEHHSRDYEPCEHNCTGELCPPPGCQVDATMMIISSSMTFVMKLLMTMTRASVTVADGICVSALKIELVNSGNENELSDILIP